MAVLLFDAHGQLLEPLFNIIVDSFPHSSSLPLTGHCLSIVWVWVRWGDSHLIRLGSRTHGFVIHLAALSLPWSLSACSSWIGPELRVHTHHLILRVLISLAEGFWNHAWHSWARAKLCRWFFLFVVAGTRALLWQRRLGVKIFMNGLPMLQLVVLRCNWFVQDVVAACRFFLHQLIAVFWRELTNLQHLRICKNWLRSFKLFNDLHEIWCLLYYIILLFLSEALKNSAYGFQV